MRFTRSSLLAATVTSVIVAAPLAAPAVAAPAAAPSVSAPAAKASPALLKAVGGDKSVALTWRPPTSIANMKTPPKVTYDVLQAGEGVIESRTGANTYVVKNLEENTRYTFTVVVFLNGKKAGKKSVTSLTKPGQLVNPRPVGNSALAWDPPVNSSEPLTYNIYKGKDLIVPGLAATTFNVTPPAEGKSDSYTVVAVNASGEGVRSTIQVTTPKPTKAG